MRAMKISSFIIVLYFILAHVLFALHTYTDIIQPISDDESSETLSNHSSDHHIYHVKSIVIDKHSPIANNMHQNPEIVSLLKSASFAKSAPTKGVKKDSVSSVASSLVDHGFNRLQSPPQYGNHVQFGDVHNRTLSMSYTMSMTHQSYFTSNNGALGNIQNMTDIFRLFMNISHIDTVCITLARSKLMLILMEIICNKAMKLEKQKMTAFQVSNLLQHICLSQGACMILLYSDLYDIVQILCDAISNIGKSQRSAVGTTLIGMRSSSPAAGVITNDYGMSSSSYRGVLSKYLQCLKQLKLAEKSLTMSQLDKCDGRVMLNDIRVKCVDDNTETILLLINQIIPFENKARNSLPKVEYFDENVDQA